MTSLGLRPGQRVRDVRFAEDVMHVDLEDGRTISVPLAWFPRLLPASRAQRALWEVSAGGSGIRMPRFESSTPSQMNGRTLKKECAPVSSAQNDQRTLPLSPPVSPLRRVCLRSHWIRSAWSAPNARDVRASMKRLSVVAQAGDSW